MHESAITRSRHVRALGFVVISLALSLVVYLWLGFNRAQTIGYAAAIYVALIALNYRIMLAKDISPEFDDLVRDEAKDVLGKVQK